jgi:hypothetical protein
MTEIKRIIEMDEDMFAKLFSSLNLISYILTKLQKNNGAD